jgi:hypothetical protein
MPAGRETALAQKLMEHYQRTQASKSPAAQKADAMVGLEDSPSFILVCLPWTFARTI